MEGFDPCCFCRPKWKIFLERVKEFLETGDNQQEEEEDDYDLTKMTNHDDGFCWICAKYLFTDTPSGETEICSDCERCYCSPCYKKLFGPDSQIDTDDESKCICNTHDPKCTISARAWGYELDQVNLLLNSI